jgi:dTDP-4-amino-4,6-dideoxygalactose transaminase
LTNETHDVSRLLHGAHEDKTMIRDNYLPFGKPHFSDGEIDAVTRVLRSGWVGMGPETIAFENELAEYVGAPHVVTVNSCTSGLFLALLVNDVGPGDEVICPSLTWCSTANAALFLGAKPVFCDVDRDTLCVSPESVQAKITPQTKAVMLVHMGGLAVEVDKIRAILPKGVAIVEDAAHALGASYSNGRPVGSSGNLTCFSFYANKNLSTGEGGAIAVCDVNVAERLRSLRQHGMPADAWKRFSHPKSLIQSQLTELGYKMNYTDLQASIGRVQLKRQPEFHAVRLAIAQYYDEHLRDLTPPLRFQQNILHNYHARHLFIIQLPLDKMSKTRDDILVELRARNVGAGIHYPPLHSMPLYADKTRRALSVTEDLCRRIISLPISASMNLDDAQYVAVQLRELLK